MSFNCLQQVVNELLVCCHQLSSSYFILFCCSCHSKYVSRFLSFLSLIHLNIFNRIAMYKQNLMEFYVILC